MSDHTPPVTTNMSYANSWKLFTGKPEKNINELSNQIKTFVFKNVLLIEVWLMDVLFLWRSLGTCYIWSSPNFSPVV